MCYLEIVLTFYSDKDSLEGRLLFAIPKKGTNLLHDSTSVSSLTAYGIGRLHEKCMELIAGMYTGLLRMNLTELTQVLISSSEDTIGWM